MGHLVRLSFGTMMLRCVLLLATLVAAILGDSKHCCSPPAWEGWMNTFRGEAGRAGSIPKVQKGAARIHYDFEGKRMAFMHYIENLEPNDEVDIEYKVIDNFDTQKRFFVMGNRCTISPLKGEMAGHCVPDEARFLEESYLGAGEDQLDTLRFRIEQAPFMVNHLSVTKDGCIPVFYSQTTLALDAPPEGSFGAFTGITPGIVDPKVFDVPEECRATNQVVNLPEVGEFISSIFTK